MNFTENTRLEEYLERWKKEGAKHGFVSSELDRVANDVRNKILNSRFAKLQLKDILCAETKKLVAQRDCQLTQNWF